MRNCPSLVLFLVLLHFFLGQPGSTFPSQMKKDLKVPQTFMVDIIATKDGLPARGLTESDFELYVDGKRAQILALKCVENVPQKKLAVIYHDMNLWTKNVKQERDEIADELVFLAGQGIEIMILQLNWVEGLRILQPFTLEEDLIRKACARAAEKTGIDESFDELDPRFQQTQGAEAAVQSEKKNELKFYVSVRRQKFEKASGGILAACATLKNLAGRKYILLISNGIPDLSSSSQADILRSGTGGRETLEAIHNRSLESMGRMRLFDPFGILKGENFERGDEVLEKAIQFSNAQNISIYSLDPGLFTKASASLSPEFSRPEVMETETIQSEERGKSIQNLRLISEGTGGLLFRGANKLHELRKNLILDLESYYQLSFRPEQRESDGKYHKLAVKINQKDVDIRFRKGYRDCLPEETKNMLLVGAYYNAELFKALPFEADFALFLTERGRFEPWISIALPVRKFFLDRGMDISSNTYSLYVWIREQEQEEKGFGAKIDIPIRMSQSFKESLQRMSYLWLFFKGPELVFQKKDYQVIYALYDPQTAEIGSWSSLFSLPDIRKKEAKSFINCILGSIAQNPKPAGEVFSINPENGSLEYGQIKFYPRVTSLFSPGQDACVFMQILSPQGKDALSFEFSILRDDRAHQTLPGEVVVFSWNNKAKVWSGIAKLNLEDIMPGEYTLKIRIPGATEKDEITREVKLTKLDYSP